MSDQHLLANESFAGYKERVLDPKSSSFCGAKWYYATVWLNTGQTTSCHHPLPHQVDPIAVRSNPKLLSNTPRKKKERAEMQKGIQCKGCDYCWKVENLDKSKISDRVYKSVLYSDELLQKAYDSDSDEDFDLKYLELSFDRTCNFACNYCNPAFSTTWAKDIKANGAYKDIGDDGANHYGHSHAEASRYNEDDNPYVEAFFKWWESDLKRTLTHLRLTGGEPLMSKHTWKLLDLMAAGDSNVTYFAINTNLNAKPSLIDELLVKAKKIKGLNLYTSNESIGSQAEYIRDGLDYKTWEDNFHKLYDSKGNQIANIEPFLSKKSVVFDVKKGQSFVSNLVYEIIEIDQPLQLSAVSGANPQFKTNGLIFTCKSSLDNEQIYFELTNIDLK